LKTLGLIVARKGSKGVQNKNKKLLNNKPLISYTIEHAKNALKLDKIVISTDDLDIAEIARNSGIEVPFIRPEILATDESKTRDVMAHCIEFFTAKNERYDAICLLQPTSPVRPEGIIDQAIEKFEESDCEVLFTMRLTPEHYNPYWSFKGINESDYLEPVMPNNFASRRQNLPKCYHRDGAVYIFNVEMIMRNNYIDYSKSIGLLIENLPFINIDSQSDWLEAESFYE